MIYIALCMDRHTDPVVAAFSEKDRAIKFCHKFVRENSRSHNLNSMVEQRLEGYVFYATYAGDGNYVSVEEVVLDDGEY